jgi:hypothetical protein
MTHKYSIRVQKFSQKPAVRNHMQEMNIFEVDPKEMGN